jgi:hypothetical protein
MATSKRKPPQMTDKNYILYHQNFELFRLSQPLTIGTSERVSCFIAEVKAGFLGK